MSLRRPSTALAGALVAFLFLVLQPSLAAAGEWRGGIETVDGVPHVLNPDTGMNAPRTIELEELWRLGGDTDDPDEFFGVINSIRTDDAGNVYLLDAQLSEIKIYSPDGEHIRTIGREGEGPGEFRRPMGMVVLPDGNLGVMMMVPGRIVVLTPAGEPVDDHPLPQSEGAGFTILFNGNQAGGNLSLVIGRNTFAEGVVNQTWSLTRIDDAGSEFVTYTSHSTEINFANAVIDEKLFDDFKNRWAMGADGGICVAETWGDYAISVFSPDGTLARVIERDLKHRRRNEEEKELVRSVFSAMLRQIPGARTEISDYDNDIIRLHPRDDGTLWVQNAHGVADQPEGVLGAFDVFDEEGRFVREITLKGQGRPLRDGYFFVEDRLYVVTGFLEAFVALQSGGAATGLSEDGDPDPMSVICYKLDLDIR